MIIPCTYMHNLYFVIKNILINYPLKFCILRCGFLCLWFPKAYFQCFTRILYFDDACTWLPKCLMIIFFKKNLTNTRSLRMKSKVLVLLTFIFNFIFQSGNSKANFDTKYQIKLQAVTNHIILHKTI